MSSGRIERRITTDEGNHLPIIDGKISPEKHDKKANEKALYRRAKSEYGLKMPYLKFQKVGVDGIYKSLRDNKNAINDLKKFFNPKTDSKWNICFNIE